MTKLGRKIRIKFIYTDELLRKILDNPTNEHLYDMKDKFAKIETIISTKPTLLNLLGN